MKRDPRLQGLSSDHHHALALCRDLLRAAADPASASVARGALNHRYRAELEPHFRIEEELLLPALIGAGLRDLAERTAAEHALLRELVTGVDPDDVPSMLRLFAKRLEEHVRFEEREMLPACEARLPSQVLDAVASRAPKSR